MISLEKYNQITIFLVPKNDFTIGFGIFFEMSICLMSIKPKTYELSN